MKRRPISPFSLSFLDIMFCGFGAVVLLVLILNNDTVKARNQHFADLRAEVLKLEKENIIGRLHLVEAKNALEQTQAEQVKTEGQAQRIAKLISRLESDTAAYTKATLAEREHINQLSSDLRSLDSEAKRLGELAETGEQRGNKVYRIAGDGDRQYLTGLKLGGRHILILLDASASMLAETVVNAIRRRNQGDEHKRRSPKWRRAVKATEWLIGNLPTNAHFQLYAFNTESKPAVAGSAGSWLKANALKDVAGAVQALKRMVPADGTSLYKAFESAKSLRPRPDNILLITDGLPTQGRTKPRSGKVSAEQRLQHFEQAMRLLPASIPVNTILLPMEGDAYAAAAYWRLAIASRGSFLTPARDWP